MKTQHTPNPQELEELIRSVAAQLNADPQRLRSSVEKGTPQELLGQLSPEDAAKLQSALADKETTARILATPQAKELIRRLTERK